MITKEFIQAFEKMVNNYQSEAGAGIIRRGDANFSVINSSLHALLHIIHTVPVFTEIYNANSVIQYLINSAIYHLDTDPTFASTTNRFVVTYHAKESILGPTVVKGPEIQFIVGNAVNFDLLEGLQNAIHNAQKSHESEISVLNRRLERTTQENSELRKRNEQLVRENATFSIHQTQLAQLEKAKALVFELHNTLNPSVVEAPRPLPTIIITAAPESRDEVNQLSQASSSELPFSPSEDSSIHSEPQVQQSSTVPLSIDTPPAEAKPAPRAIPEPPKVALPPMTPIVGNNRAALFTQLGTVLKARAEGTSVSALPGIQKKSPSN